MEISFIAALWEWSGKGAWCFVSLPEEYYDMIQQLDSSSKRGFGSVKVAVRIGTTSWKTSLFPDSKPKSYLLPIRKDVRTAESLSVGDTLSITVRLIDY